MLEKFEKIGSEAIEALKQITDPAQLEEFRVKYLGRKGEITQMLSQIGQLATERGAIS